MGGAGTTHNFCADVCRAGLAPFRFLTRLSFVTDQKTQCFPFIISGQRLCFKATPLNSLCAANSHVTYLKFPPQPEELFPALQRGNARLLLADR